MMTAETLRFDPAQHRYHLGQRELISVTRVLTEAGLIDSRWYTEEAAIRGHYVHAAIQLHHEGDLAEGSLDPTIRPYFDGYLKFLADTGFTVTACEERVFSEALGCAGTLDLRGLLKRGKWTQYPSMVDIVDVKTGVVPHWVGYQTAAYARMLPADVPFLRWRWCLNLMADGTYRLMPLDKRTDEHVFLSALAVAQAKRGWM